MNVFYCPKYIQKIILFEFEITLQMDTQLLDRIVREETNAHDNNQNLCEDTLSFSTRLPICDLPKRNILLSPQPTRELLQHINSSALVTPSTTTEIWRQHNILTCLKTVADIRMFIL